MLVLVLALVLVLVVGHKINFYHCHTKEGERSETEWACARVRVWESVYVCVYYVGMHKLGEYTYVHTRSDVRKSERDWECLTLLLPF